MSTSEETQAYTDKRRLISARKQQCKETQESTDKIRVRPDEKHQVETSNLPGKPCYTAITPAETRAEINLLCYGYEIPIMSQDRPQKSTNDTFTIYNVNVVK
jgi:hypothetical protein